MKRSLLVLTAGLVLAGFVPTAQATLFEYYVNMNGANEAPPNPSLGIGYGDVVYDDVAHTLFMRIEFSGLTGTTSAAHIHSATAMPGVGTAGVATTLPSFAGFPLGVRAGFFTNTLDLTLAGSWNQTFVNNNGGTLASAEAALAAGLAQGRAYFNIHSSSFGGGEIRGFPQLVPEPASIALIGFAALMLRRRFN